MISTEAYHLPGLADADVERWETLGAGPALQLRYPILNADGVRRLADRLRTARHEALVPVPASRIAHRIGAVAARFGVVGDPLRERAELLLARASGYSPAMVAHVLDGMSAGWRPDVLERLLDSELGTAAVLDAFVETPGGSRRRALGPDLALNLFAGNVPGVAVTAIIRCLLVKSAVLGKTGRTEPVLPVLFAAALADAEPELGRCLAVTYWPGGAPIMEGAAFGEADTVVVYGGADAICHVRAHVPATARLVEHGPRVSVALIGAAALGSDADRTAADLARAVATFDQLGCVSPHVAYVERGGAVEPAGFAHLLANALAALEHELPRGRLSTEEAAAVLDFRAAAEFREIAGADVRTFGAAGDPFTVVYDSDPRFEASCLHRSVRVKPIDRLENTAALLTPIRGLLQTIGVAGADDRAQTLAQPLAELGASRITSIDRMPWPPADWSHDGHRPLAELVRWVDLERD